MKLDRVIILFLFLSAKIVNPNAYAQNSWEDNLKLENGLVLEQRQDVKISVSEDGKLVINSKTFEETKHFSDNANIFSEQSVGYSQTFTDISDLEAYSYVPTENGKFKKLKVDEFVTTDSRSDGIFYDDQKKISFVFPALKSGSKTVVSYNKKFHEPRLWGYFLFSSFFPVKKSVFTVEAPAGVTVRKTRSPR